MCVCTMVFAEEKIVLQYNIKDPRAFAYHIGDTLQRSIRLQLRKPYQLETELLPKRKRMGRWVLVISSSYRTVEHEAFTQYDIDLQYQIVNMIPELKEVILPRHYLVYKNSDEENSANPEGKLSRLEIPPYKIGVSSVISQEGEPIQVDKKPGLLNQTFNSILLYASLLIVTLICLALLLWGLPFNSRIQPFAEALQSLKAIKNQLLDEQGYENALKIIHKAFNVTAGKTLFIENIDNFLELYPRYSPLHSDIVHFFDQSNQYFYKGQDATQISSKRLPPLIEFVKSCHNIEQGRLK